MKRLRIYTCKMSLVLSLMFWIFGICFWNKVEGTPSLGFPINSQVPPVARVSMPFSFVFAKNTFNDIRGEVKYAVSALPPWLRFDPHSRKFYGTPSKSDVGVVRFNLTATDTVGTGINPVIFVVTSESPPSVKIPLDQQLRMYGTVDSNGAFIITSSKKFDFRLNKDTFRSGGGKILTYYCVSGDNTPLPSWIKFDPISFRVWGVSPVVESDVAPPLYFSFKIIASDVLGFSGSEASFSMMIMSQHLQLKQTYYFAEAIVGYLFVFPIPFLSLTRGGVSIPQEEIPTLKVSVVSSWIIFDKSKLALVGTPTSNDPSEDVLVSIMDRNSYKVTLYVKVNVIGHKKVPTGTIDHIKPCPSSGISSGYSVPFLPDVPVIVGKPFSFQIGDPSRLSSFDKVDVSCIPKEASSWLRFNRYSMRLSGTAPTEGNVSIRVHTMIYSSGENYDQYFVVYANKDTKHVNKTTFPSIIVLGIIVPVILIMFFFFLCFCISRRIRKKTRFSPSNRYISRPILSDARYGQWPMMNERTWDEPQRLSAFDIFKSTSGNGLSGFVAEVKEEPTNTDPDSGITPKKTNEKTKLISPYSIRVLPIKEDSFKEDFFKAPAYTSKDILQSSPNQVDAPPQTSIGPPGYGMPHRSWRRTTLSSSFWPGSQNYHDSRTNAGIRNASASESFTVKLVNDSTSHSDTSSGVISNVISSSTPSYDSSKELSGKSSNSKVTVGSYLDDSTVLRECENQTKEIDDTRRFRKSGLHVSKVRPWSTQTDDTDSIDATSFISSEHSRNEFLYDENDNPRLSSINESRSARLGSFNMSDSNSVQYRIATKVPTPLHSYMQTPPKADAISTFHRKGSLIMKQAVLDRPKMFEYSRSHKASQQSRSLSTEGSSEMAFI